MNSKWLNEKDLLIQYVNIEKKSYEEMGKLYNCSGSNIRKVLDTLGIDREPRRKVNPKETFNKGHFSNTCKYCSNPIPKSKTFCNQECEGKYKSNLGYLKLLNGDPSIMTANYSPKAYKLIILLELDNKCSICGMSPEWNNKHLVFILDHIDGHASNNKRSNLRCICPNCDSQLDTYKSKNKNSDRVYYKHFNRSAPKEILDVENPLNEER